MKSAKLFNIDYHPLPKKYILEEMEKLIAKNDSFKQVVSLNPENIVIAQHDNEFSKVLSQSDYQIVDGIGIVLAEMFLGRNITMRITGVDLMVHVLNLCYGMSLSIGFIGGKENLAEGLANCYQQKYPRSKFFGISGFRNKDDQNPSEIKNIIDRVSVNRPQIVFVAFGSPYQEKWIWENRDIFKGVICIGVGGAFDFLSGKIPRAPKIIRNMGLEWLFRLLMQPWRIGRQMRLPQFLLLVIKKKLKFA